MAPIKSNNPYASYFDFFSKSGLDAVSPAPVPEGITATGGVISDYEDSGTYYRAHIFTSSGTFVVSAIGNLPSNVAILAAGGGGGGGQHNGAGGGAGGPTNIDGHGQRGPSSGGPGGGGNSSPGTAPGGASNTGSGGGSGGQAGNGYGGAGGSGIVILAYQL